MYLIHRYCAIGKLIEKDKEVKVWSIPICEKAVNYKKYILYRGALENSGKYFYKEKNDCKEVIDSIEERSDVKAIRKFFYRLKRK